MPNFIPMELQVISVAANLFRLMDLAGALRHSSNLAHLIDTVVHTLCWRAPTYRGNISSGTPGF